MTPSEYLQLRELFAAACDLNAEQQEAFLHACPDQRFREELRSLLESDAAPALDIESALRSAYGFRLTAGAG